MCEYVLVLVRERDLEGANRGQPSSDVNFLESTLELITPKKASTRGAHDTTASHETCLASIIKPLWFTIPGSLLSCQVDKSNKNYIRLYDVIAKTGSNL